MKLAMLGVLIMISGCAANVTPQKAQEKEYSVVTIRKEFPPQIWADHKKLNISPSACSAKGKEILSSIGFIKVVKSRHGEFIYGNYSNNRAAIKCVPVDGGTFVYAAVAGPKVKVVEKLRNEIMWQL